MKSKYSVCNLAVLGFVAVAAAATALPRAIYRIELRDGSQVIAKDLPYRRGSVVMFHLRSSGVLTSVPEEEVARVVTGATARQTVTAGNGAELRPGDVVFLGPTGGGAPSTAPGLSAAPAAASIPGGVYDPRNPAYGYSAPNGVTAVTAQTPAGPGDVARAISADVPTADNPIIGPNGFPTTPAGATPQVGPNGEPALNLPGSTGTTPVTIGPNGTPVLAPAGAPGFVAPPIGPNGTPVLAPGGATGSASPPVGPNGTPVLAPAGAPGSTSPPVGPNGTPVLAQPGTPGSTSPPTGPNGTPSTGRSGR